MPLKTAISSIFRSQKSLDEIAKSFPVAEHAQATQRVVAILTEAVNTGVFLPGDQLSEVRVAEILNVSRNTLRQAFMILVAGHLLEQIPNRGVFVATPDCEEIREIYTSRRALENTGIWLSQPGEHPELRATVELAQKAQESRDAVGMSEHNHNFHRGLVALAGSKRLSNRMEGVLAEMRLVFFAMPGEPAFDVTFIQDNEKILRLIEEGKKVEAIEFLDEYLTRSQEYFIGRF